MGKLNLNDLHDELDRSEMAELAGGKESVFIFSAETLAILGADPATVAARKAEEDNTRGHHD